MSAINGVRPDGRKPGTPGRLLLWITVPVLGVLACALLLAGSVGALRGDLGTVGAQQPQVVAASRLSFDLAAMDGQAADVLLLGDASGLGETRSQAYQRFEQDQADANSRLESLGNGIDAIPNGPRTFVAIENQLSQYTQYISYAMYIDGQAHGQHPGRPPSAALQAYDHASALMNDGGDAILAQARYLYIAEQDADSQPSGAGLATIWHLQVACGLLIVFVVIRLLVAQRKLSRVFRRTLNPLLALATVTTLIFGVLLFSALGAAESAYHEQNLNGADSVSTLWLARATAADMHASESRWLLQAGDPSPQRSTAMKTAQEPFASGEQWMNLGPRLPSAVKAELGTYLVDDAHMRGLTGGTGSFDAQMSAAVAYQMGPTDAAYAAFDSGLEQTIDVDQQSFAATTAQGRDGLTAWLWLPWLWMAGTIALIVLGFAPRLREYR